MAEPEAQTAWQRGGNFCFVNVDARSGSKFSSSPSSSSSKAEPDGSRFDHLTPDCMAYNPNLELTVNTKWWLNLEPNFGPQKEFTYEQLKVLEAELEDLNSGFVHKTAIITDYYQCDGVFSTQNDTKGRAYSFAEQPSMGMQERKDETGSDAQLHKKMDRGEFWYSDDHIMNLDSYNCLSSGESKKLSSSLDSQWVGTEKTEPWWRSAGKGELASLVAQKSLEHIDNCDLPRPQIRHRRNSPSARSKLFNSISSIDQMAELGFSNMDTHSWGSFTSGHSIHESGSPSSQNIDEGTISKDELETQSNAEADQTKAQLLEALCHSQTRAREAEKAAQKAYTEKEHIVPMFFKQASQLFAYKQWLQLLQLENFCLQLKNKDQPISGLFPWSPYKGRHGKKGRRRAGKKSDKPRYEISKGAVAFAVELGLAGAGLLLGWTMGWLFPTV